MRVADGERGVGVLYYYASTGGGYNLRLTHFVHGRHTSSMHYSLLYSEITDSSLWEEPYHVRILFVTMMARRLADHVVYGDEYRLKKWSNLKTMEEVKDALKVLGSPDKLRPGQEYGGRRIEKVEGGWKLLNGEKYELLMKQINERARKARWARENRNAGKLAAQVNGTALPGERAHERAVRAGRKKDAQALDKNQPHEGVMSSAEETQKALEREGIKPEGAE